MSEYKDALKLANKESREFTKECIKIATVELAQKEPFDKLTISAIVQRAGVSRAAFYRNYHSKEDVITELCNEILDKVKNFVVSNHSEDDYLFYLKLFSTVKKNKDGIDSLISIALLPVFQAHLNLASLYTILSMRFARYNNYAQQAIGGAFSYIFYSWYSGGMKESAEQMAALCSSYSKAIACSLQTGSTAAEASDHDPNGGQP